MMTRISPAFSAEPRGSTPQRGCTCSGGADQEDALGDAGTHSCEALGVLQKLHHLPHSTSLSAAQDRGMMPVLQSHSDQHHHTGGSPKVGWCPVQMTVTPRSEVCGLLRALTS